MEAYGIIKLTKEELQKSEEDWLSEYKKSREILSIVKKGNLDKLKDLLINNNFSQKHLDNALRFSFFVKKIEISKGLIKYGANIDSDDCLQLLRGSIYNIVYDKQVIKDLITLGMKVPKNYEVELLRAVAVIGDTDLMKFLIEHANINIHANNNYALVVAKRHRQKEMRKFLEQYIN